MIVVASNRYPRTRSDDVGRPGMTLVEMLVATAVTLILVGLVVQLFGVVGGSVTASRSLIESTDQLRSTAFRLRTDLSGITAEPLPPARSDSDSGYLEITEGPRTDATDPTGILGDYDDVLMFTTRSKSAPFVGTFRGTQSIESDTAEVAWFCQRASVQPIAGLTLYNLYRKQMLVMGFVGAPPFLANSNSIADTLPSAYDRYDLSLRPEGNFLYPNSLGNLTKRENRFQHTLASGLAASFPFSCRIGPTASDVVYGLTSGRQGEDLILTNVIAFDVRVYDPEAAMRSRDGQVLTPGDRGYGNGTTIPPTPKGAYIDLGADIGVGLGKSGTSLGAAMETKSRFIGACVYDTWSTHYEFNGINEDAVIAGGAANPDDLGTDTGSDGQDNNGNGLVDELAERDTLPPYSVPLRGLEVRVRVYEPSSRQVRQVTVRHTFVPH